MGGHIAATTDKIDPAAGWAKRKASAEGGEEISAEAFAKGGDSDELKEVSVTRLRDYLTPRVRRILPKNIIPGDDENLKKVMTLRNGKMIFARLLNRRWPFSPGTKIATNWMT